MALLLPYPCPFFQKGGLGYGFMVYADGKTVSHELTKGAGLGVGKGATDRARNSLIISIRCGTCGTCGLLLFDTKKNWRGSSRTIVTLARYMSYDGILLVDSFAYLGISCNRRSSGASVKSYHEYTHGNG